MYLYKLWKKRSDKTDEMSHRSHKTDPFLHTKNEQPPFCIPCNEPLTIKHILISCIDFNHIRSNYYQAQNMKDLFNNTSDIKILEFLKEINIFSKL